MFKIAGSTIVLVTAAILVYTEYCSMDAFLIVSAITMAMWGSALDEKTNK